MDKSAKPLHPTLQRLLEKGLERDKVANSIARMLWDNGPALADCEAGGRPDTWDEITDALRLGMPDKTKKAERELHAARRLQWREYHNRALALLALPAADGLLLAKLLIDNTQKQHRETELSLWRRIEVANGLEAGSLTNAPGVRQTVAV